MDDLAYNVFAGQPFVTPLNPGATAIIPAGSTGPQIQRIQATFKAETEVYKQHQAVDLALKQQLITAVPQMYIKTLAHNVLGFTNVTSKQILRHLKATYG